MPDHTADRPTWSCRTCGEPWPCAPARVALRAELGGTQLRIYGWMMLEDAAGDLPESTAPELFRRFLRWTRTDAEAATVPVPLTPTPAPDAPPPAHAPSPSP